MANHLVLLGLMLIGAITAADANAWRNRTVYQILTDRFWRSNNDTASPCPLKVYCGGDFDGIAQKLDYVQDLGFDAIWISPVVDNIEPGYHGYWFRNWEAVNFHFGDEASLKRLVDAAHARGMLVMVDVVANHVGPMGVDYTQIYPFNQESHYHKRCQIVDFDNQTECEICRLLDLPDLNQTVPWVRQYLIDWIKNHITQFKFDAIRIDTVPHVEKAFWKEYTEAGGVYSIGEVFRPNETYVGDYQNYMDATLNYPMWYTIKDVFGNGTSMTELTDRWSNITKNFRDPDLLGLFVDNHDNPRFLYSFPEWKRFKSALAFALNARGVPMFYYGSEQAFAGGPDPNNREPMWNNFDPNHEIYKFIKTINQARLAQKAMNQPFAETFVADNLYGFTRGRFLVVLTNDPYTKGIKGDIPAPTFSEGEKVCNALNASDCLTVKAGTVSVSLSDGETKIYIPQSSSFFSSKLKSARDVLSNDLALE